MRHALPAALAILGLPGAAAAATVGLPIFTTEATQVSIADNFVGNVPSGIITLQVDATIASAQGAPELVGQDLAFSFTGFTDSKGFQGNGNSFPEVSFSVGAFGDLSTGILGNSQFSIFLPYTKTDGLLVLDDPFQGFGGPFGTFEETVATLFFEVADPLPTKIFRIYCLQDDPDTCLPPVADDGVLPLTEIDGKAVVVDYEDEYVESSGDFVTTLTFATVGGPPIVATPLPGSMWLLAGALGGLAVWRRAGRSVRTA